ncbi:hypothetical protein NE547_15695 [Flavonifractor sp. DFI.6.63]|uniref:hypothetical protein n=1 Tax=Flavonifractor sp. DFI.6.63 TaxID=2963704 RepID=UPI00210C3D4D|nr:hypothetical protein [Flavonifractor sp. DFI.6.63]MCQ5030950.1 hypothetical protein [Flavonifractor sp. DFI.6.63]
MESVAAEAYPDHIPVTIRIPLKILRYYRIIQRVRIGAKIYAAKRRKTAGMLFVLQGFATHLWGKLAAKTCVGNCAVMP